MFSLPTFIMIKGVDFANTKKMCYFDFYAFQASALMNTKAFETRRTLYKKKKKKCLAVGKCYWYCLITNICINDKRKLVTTRRLVFSRGKLCAYYLTSEVYDAVI